MKKLVFSLLCALMAIAFHSCQKDKTSVPASMALEETAENAVQDRDGAPLIFNFIQFNAPEPISYDATYSIDVRKASDHSLVRHFQQTNGRIPQYTPWYFTTETDEDYLISITCHTDPDSNTVAPFFVNLRKQLAGQSSCTTILGTFYTPFSQSWLKPMWPKCF